MQIHLHPRHGEAAAGVQLVILGVGLPVVLDGIVARKLRPGWITLESPRGSAGYDACRQLGLAWDHLGKPARERWAVAFRWLTPLQRQRIESAQFFTMLQAEAGRR